MDMSLSKLLEIVKRQGSLECCSPRGHKESRHDLATEHPSPLVTVGSFSMSISVFLFFCHTAQGMHNLSSLTRGVSGAVVLKAPSPSRWAVREAPVYLCLVGKFLCVIF